MIARNDILNRNDMKLTFIKIVYYILTTGK